MTERFTQSAPQRQALFQPDCPIYVHCFCICTDRVTGAAFAQVRMVNRSAWTVAAVWLHLESERGSRTALLTDLAAAPCTVFGEEQLLPLGDRAPAALAVTVERIVFDGGLRWERPAKDRLLTPEAAGWPRCSCGLPNPSDAALCPLCGRLLRDAPEERTVTQQPVCAVTPCVPETPNASPEEDFSLSDDAENWPEDDVPEGLPCWLTVLFCILAMLALMAIAAVAALCVWKRVR